MYEKTCNQFLKIYTKKETVNLNLWNFIALTDLLIRLRLSNSDFYKSINQKSLNCKPGSVWGLILNHSNILHLHPTWKLYYFLPFQKWVIFMYIIALWNTIHKNSFISLMQYIIYYGQIKIQLQRNDMVMK